MRTFLQGFIIFLVIALIATSWALVLAHQLDWGALNVAQYPSLRDSLPGAYAVVVLSAGAIGAGLLLLLFEKES